MFQNNYEEYDGFVVLHGTDTMSYTASALSFMFENIGKCVVITGSQVSFKFNVKRHCVRRIMKLMIIGIFGIAIRIAVPSCTKGINGVENSCLLNICDHVTRYY